MNRAFHGFFRTSLFCVVGCFLGCEPHIPAPQQTTPLPKNDTEYVLMIVLDLSGSFSELMADRGKAYEFALRVYDRYFRDRIGCKDELIIAQLSGTSRSVIWRGSPIELRQAFPSSTKFKEFLMSKADPNGSVIHDGLAHAIELLTIDRAVASGEAKSAVFVLSDMIDNGPNPEQSERRINQALADYGRKNGIVGLWYVDQDLVLRWREKLQNSGLKDYRVEYIDEHPDLPSF